MKKIFLTSIIIAGSCLLSRAQFTKGNILAGGSVGISFTTNKSISGSTTTTNYSTNSFSISPQVGYFFLDNFAAGAGILLSSSTTKADGSPSGNSFSSFSFSPFGRYYFGKFFGQAGIGFGSYTQESTNNNNITTTFKGSTFNWSLGGGYVILLNQHVGLEPQILYRSDSQTPDGSSITNRNAGLFLQLGLQVYLSK